MKLRRELLTVGALLLTAASANSASATSYNITFDNSLSALITTVPVTGNSEAITSISGTFLGAPITGIIENPYSPNSAYYYDIVGAPQENGDPPSGFVGIPYEYNYDNLLLSGNNFDGAGLLLMTAANVANLFSDGSSVDVAYSAVGVNVPATILFDTFSITPVSVAEPATWEIMIIGFGLAGFGLRRRNHTTRVANPGRVRLAEA